MEFLPIHRAILSVTDKTDLPRFATFLSEMGVELFSTGGTKKKIVEAGLAVASVSSVTGFPEILDGRVKTLHPHIHGGILANKENSAHLATLAEHRINTFDLVCVNLYNFADAVQKNLNIQSAVEEIDIGGPTMLRAAAKNFHSVLVVPGPQHYDTVMNELRLSGKISLKLRRFLAAETFRLVSEYDAMIAQYLLEHTA